jgi:hypothetical protein
MECRSEVPAHRDGPGHPIECRLAQLGKLTVGEVSSQAPERGWVRAALGRFHYLGFGGAVGENLQYLVRDGQGCELAGLVFGAAAWKCQDRYTCIQAPVKDIYLYPLRRDFRSVLQG